jgi:hypothetical protein
VPEEEYFGANREKHRRVKQNLRVEQHDSLLIVYAFVVYWSELLATDP